MNGQTPAGAALTIRRTRDRSSVVIEIDRALMLDSTPSQVCAVQALAVREIGSRRNRSVSFIASPSLWAVPTTGDRERIVLARLYAIEAGEL